MLNITSFIESWAMACTPLDLILKHDNQITNLTAIVMSIEIIPAKGRYVDSIVWVNLEIDSNKTCKNEPTYYVNYSKIYVTKKKLNQSWKQRKL